METSLWVRRRGLNSTKNPRELGFKSASKKATISATIAPRSGFDRTSIVVLGHRRSLADRWETNPRQNLLDRGSIAPRSRLDRAAIAARSRRDRGVLPRSSTAVRFNLQVAGGSRSLDRVNPDYESRPPSDSIFRWLEGHDRLIG